ncbi:MAG: outer membrane protein assembly factor BamA [Sphingobium sp.]|nr:outer membrane protein assembly factor BamA [Sphingobium sp.]MCP5398853.1 outer membrane protein assembly factor BamA [Sphingomonas sp.]
MKAGSLPKSGWAVALLAGTILGGVALGTPAYAQQSGGNTVSDAAPAAPAPAMTVKSIAIEGEQRLEAETILSYTKLRVGNAYTRETLDSALRDLYETELFANVQIRDNAGALTISVKENPVINRIVLEGNKRLKDDKIRPEIRMAPRQIYTRSKVRADVARIIELYRRKGRFAAIVEPKMVELDQNRVDIIFEITEGPKSKVRQINIIGNEKFSDGKLRGEMATKAARWYRIFSSGTSYDPDRLAYDQQKLRQFYLTEGYADFRVVSAVAELTPDKQDFIITYVVEEGDRYKFGDVKVESEIRDLSGERLTKMLPMDKGDWYDAKQVEDTVDQLSETAGLFGYAFSNVQPDFARDKGSLTMGITFRIADAPRVYVERIDINGNTLTQDKVVRREFRLAEGDAFNSFQVRRSKDRINSLGFFQEKLEIEQKPGSAPDRIVLETNVEEKSTGELSLSAGFSSLERFIFSASVTQRNFRGKGQELRTSVNWSNYSKSVEVGFTEPYFMDKNIALGGDIYRRDLNSFRYLNSSRDRDTTYEQTTTGFQIRAGVPLTEFTSLALRYSLNFDDVTLDRSTYFLDLDGDGTSECSPLLAGRYLCDAIGKRTTSSIGYSFIYDTRDNRLRPTRGRNAVFSQDFAGLGGSVKYLRSRINGGQWFPLGGGFIFSLKGEAGYIFGLEKQRYGIDFNGNSYAIEKVRLTDRFFLGEPQLRGFDIRGVGPRVLRYYLQDDGSGNYIRTSSGSRNNTDDALGGKLYYLAHAEVEIPLGSGARELGLRPSIFVDAGAVGKVKRPSTIPHFNGLCQDNTTGARAEAPATGQCPNYDSTTGGSTTHTLVIPPFEEQYVGDTLAPRLSVGFGINWNSPFGPFRIDIAKALLKEPGDDTKLITFNIGTQF